MARKRSIYRTCTWKQEWVLKLMAKDRRNRLPRGFRPEMVPCIINEHEMALIGVNYLSSLKEILSSSNIINESLSEKKPSCVPFFLVV